MEICHQILEKIKAYNTIIIHRHMKPDPDALGSQVGLKALLEHHFPEKTIKVVGFNEPTLTWLAKMDQVEDTDYQGALAIICDTANTARIDDKRYLNAETIIKIDHHPNDEVYGDLVWVDTNSSSASEMIALFAEATNLELSDYAAKMLCAGIIGDTGRFLYPSTSARTLRIASQLREHNFDYAELTRKMDTMSFKIAKLQGYVYDHLEVDENGAARVILTQEILRKYDVTDAEQQPSLELRAVSILLAFGESLWSKQMVTTAYVFAVNLSQSMVSQKNMMAVAILLLVGQIRIV
jgi:phosphoesterase RecJ-like protein